MRYRVLESLPVTLQEHESSLHGVVREAITLFQSRFGALRAGMTIRSERSNIHDCMVEIAKKIFPNNFFFTRNLFTLRIGGHQIKLKKHDEHLETSSSPTQMVLDFEGQKQIDLFGEEPSTHIHLGYVPDNMDLMKSPVWITCPRAYKKIDWVYELRAEAGQALAPIPPATMPDDPPKPSVSPKKLPSTGESEDIT